MGMPISQSRMERMTSASFSPLEVIQSSVPGTVPRLFVSRAEAKFR